VLGGADGGLNRVAVERTLADGTRTTYRPPHLSKDQDIRMKEGDVVRVSTPGGGGYGDPAARSAEAIARDVERGYYDAATAAARFGSRG
jgi:N-methylhydantoinase B